jgi:2-polyprenyl-6-methoxyphenol hydroxylase-like FAD-dependent oxidoreductase
LLVRYCHAFANVEVSNGVSTLRGTLIGKEISVMSVKITGASYPSSEGVAPLEVLIIGAGLGGLCLAQGLRQAGIAVAVYERDPGPNTRPQGYRIHLNPDGSRALHTCLPASLFDLFAATSGEPARFPPAYLNEQLEDIAASIAAFPAITPPAQTDPFHPHRAVDRLLLRSVLLSELDDVVYFGREFSRYERLSDGRVRVIFADGTVATASLLVGADGTGSPVRGQLLPEAEVRDTGIRCVYAKTYVHSAVAPPVREALGPFMERAFTIVNGPQGQSIFCGAFKTRLDVQAAAASYPEIAQEVGVGDYLMWVYAAPRAQFEHDFDEETSLRRTEGIDLLELVRQRITDWHSLLRALVEGAAPETAAVIGIREAMPVAPWKTDECVTLLGDAIHAMMPTGGEGANVALRDAAELCQALIAVSKGTATQAESIASYEAKMLRDGFAAVQRSQALAHHLFKYPQRREPAKLP